MTICIDIRNLAQKNLSGVGIYTKKLIENLLEIDKVNQYKLFYNSKKFPLIKKYYPNVTYYDFKKSNRLINLSMKLFNYPKIDKMVDGCDIFFAPNINFFAFSKNKNIKKIITIHDISFYNFPEFYSKKSILWHKIININKILKHFDYIITVSNNTKYDIVKTFNIDESKIKTIYLGTDEPKYNIEESKIRSEIKQISKKQYLLNINTTEPRKNIESIIKSFIELKNSGELKETLLIIAGGAGKSYYKILEMIEACNYKDDIKILNYISEEEKQYLYQNAKVILFPSFYEGFGLPIIEAQKYGKPVITSSNSSMSEICNCNSILINPYNINEMKFAIINLLNDEIYEKYANLSLKNSKNFTWENCAINTLQLFNSLAI